MRRLDYVAVETAREAGPFGCPDNGSVSLCPRCGCTHRHAVFAWLRRGQPVPICFRDQTQLEPVKTTPQGDSNGD